MSPKKKPLPSIVERFRPVRPQTDGERQALYEHKLSLRTLLLDKLVLALLFVAIGYLITRSLEAYKAGLQLELEQFKTDQELMFTAQQELQERLLAQQEQSHARELAQLRSAQTRQLEEFRQQGERQSEALRVVLNTQSQLAARRVTAYATVWTAFGEMFNVVATLPLPAFSNDLYPDQDSLLLTAGRAFQRVFYTEKIFLDGATSQRLDGLVGLVLFAASTDRGKTVIQNTYRDMADFEPEYRARMDSVLSTSPAVIR